MMDYDKPMDTLDEGGKVVEEWESRTEALLLGRKTYEIFAGSWGVWNENAAGFQGELTRKYNRIPKYVASRTLTELGWRTRTCSAPTCRPRWRSCARSPAARSGCGGAPC